MQSFSGPFDTFVIFLGSTVCLNYKITSWWNPWQAFKGIGTLTSSKASILVLTMMEVSLGFASLPLALPTFKLSAFFAIKDETPVQSSSPAGTALEKYIPPCKRDWPQASWISDHLKNLKLIYLAGDAPGSVFDDSALTVIPTENSPVEYSPVNSCKASAYAVQYQEEPEGYSACYENTMTTSQSHYTCTAGSLNKRLFSFGVRVFLFYCFKNQNSYRPRNNYTLRGKSFLLSFLPWCHRHSRSNLQLFHDNT